MGRNSVEATKASLILWARAARRRFSAGLTYFFLPRGAVAEWCVDEVRAVEAVGFFVAVVAWPVVAAGFFVDALPDLGLWVVELGVSEELAACGSDCFPSTGLTASKTQSIAASTRAGACVEEGGKTGSIDSL
jgi:hypothetical protein